MGSALSIAMRRFWVAALLGACAPTPPAGSDSSIPADPPATGAGEPLSVAAETGPVREESLDRMPSTARRLDSGLLLVAPAGVPDRLARTAHIRLTIATGASVAGTALPWLVAESVADLPHGGRPPLRAAIAAQGGTLELRVDRDSTTFAVETPPETWRRALADLMNAIAAFPDPAPEFAEFRAQAAERAATRIAADPLTFTIDQLLAGDPAPGAAAHLRALRAATEGHARSFHRSRYGPEGAALGVLVPGLAGSAALRDAGSLSSAWRGPVDREERPPGPAARGIYWASGDRAPRLAILLGAPDASEPDARSLHLLRECITMAGVGGRLEQALDAAGAGGIAFSSRRLLREGRAHLVLQADVDAAEVDLLWRILADVHGSFSDTPPSAAEVELATRRLRLRDLTTGTDPRDWLESAMWRLLRGGESSPAPGASGPADPGPGDLAAAAGLLREQPLAIAVVGGEPPSGITAVRLPELEARQPAPSDSPRDLFAAARAHVQRAMQVVGGADRLQSLRGFSARSLVSSGTGPTLAERLTVDGIRLQRERTVLATTVKTEISPEASYESAGDERRELSAAEVRRTLVETHRHPLLLLAACSRGELRLRLHAIRSVGDRELVVLDALDSPLGRLRVHLDRSSGLVRQVESWSALPGAGYVLETYSDYRSAGGFRVAFHRVTRNEDATTHETEWSEFRPAAN